MNTLGGKVNFISIFLPIIFSYEAFAATEVEILREEVASLREEVKQLKGLLKDTIQAQKMAAKDPAPEKKNTTSQEEKISVAKEEHKLTVPSSTETLPPPEKSIATLQKGTEPHSAEPVNHSQSKLATSQKKKNTISVQKETKEEKLIPTLSWTGYDITALMVGGANTGYSNLDNKNGSFNIIDFNPILLASYQDLLLMRASVNFSLDDDGDTQTSLDFLNLNLFANDYVELGIGKFDSSLGQFVQSLSPSWINKLPTAPVGFDSDEAAPQSEIGVELRGGFPFVLDTKGNYSFFVSNGPRGYVDQTNMVIDHISTDGFPKNYGNFIYGGRLGFLPVWNLELGISAAGGKLALFDLADNSILLQRDRKYLVLGADAVFNWEDLCLRGEIIQQKILSQNNSIIVPGSATWRAWYVQAAYRIPSTKWEPVIRYGKYTTPISGDDQRQWAFGINYWFAPSIAIQTAYQRNHCYGCTDNAENNFLIQLVFGF